jgi:hypothetical protein
MGVYWIVLLRPPGLPEGFDELHVHLQLVAGALFLVALPPGDGALVALGGRHAAQAGLAQDAPDPFRR